MALFLGLMTSRTGSHDVTNNRDLPTPEYLEGVDDTSFFYGTRLEHSPHGGSCVCEQRAHVHGLDKLQRGSDVRCHHMERTSFGTKSVV